MTGITDEDSYFIIGARTLLPAALTELQSLRRKISELADELRREAAAMPVGSSLRDKVCEIATSLTALARTEGRVEG